MVRHINVKISRCLRLGDKRLGEMFGMNGDKVREYLNEAKSKGHIFLQTEGCENYDPLKGCTCGEAANNG